MLIHLGIGEFFQSCNLGGKRHARVLKENLSSRMIISCSMEYLPLSSSFPYRT
jgi:hypothetical protein